MTLLSRYQQILHDHQDFDSTEGSALDQGRFKLPIIHAIEAQAKVGNMELLSIFRARKSSSGISEALNKHVLLRLKELGSFAYAKKVLQDLLLEIVELLSVSEKQAREENWILRLMVRRLKV
jgi:geranylgeranyl pyrophosphate synthase